MSSPYTIVGLGEVLWDLLPGGRQLGGAPANFAYCSRLLGNTGIVVSRVGRDDLGAELRQKLRVLGVSTEFLQTDNFHPTGTVQVQIDVTGQPEFEFTQSVGWDFLEWDAEVQHLAPHCDAVCFGTLAQRCEQSRRTIWRFLESTSDVCLRVLDVNLRPPFYSPEILMESLKRANAMKLNGDELPIVATLLGISEDEFCANALVKFGMRFVCVTRGEKGSLLWESKGLHEHSGFRVKVTDTVGAGDAFTAGLVFEYLRGAPWDAMNETANRMGAWVASCAGGMPSKNDGFLDVLDSLKRNP